jgi:transcription-repair coupling factor (superfamily II helicase)
MRDLEIRGAGNLLGTKQSGHIAAVGFDLYCKLLRQSVDRLKGRAVSARSETSFRADFLALNETDYGRASAHVPLLPAFFPADFVAETSLRVNAYRELAECLSEKELDDLTTSWRDRFGRFPDPVANLLRLNRVKIRAAGKKITTVEIKGQKLTLGRNGSPIMIDNRHPRLTSTEPGAKLDETLKLLAML